MIWRGNPYIEHQLVPISRLIPNEEEYRDKPSLFHDLEVNGQQWPIVIEENRIKDGNNRYRILSSLGFTHIAAIGE